LGAGLKRHQRLAVRAEERGQARQFEVVARVDTPEEVEYIRHGGILPFVLRELARA
jgi:aconitate hydratase